MKLRAGKAAKSTVRIDVDSLSQVESLISKPSQCLPLSHIATLLKHVR